MGTTLRIDNIDVLLTGDVARPRSNASTLYVADGRIAGIGQDSALDAQVEYVLDASGLLAAPGLWDMDHRLYFGDHSPWFEARGFLAATVESGTTCVVSAGPVPLARLPRDPHTAVQLALLTQRSWLHDRPLELRVHARGLMAVARCKARDLEFAAAQGIRYLTFSSPLPSKLEARVLAEMGLAAQLRIVAYVDGRMRLAADASSVEDALQAIQPAIVLGVNGGPTPPPADALDWLIERSRAAIGLSLSGNLRLARAIAARLADRGELERLLIGTGMPSRHGIVPGGVQRMLQALVDAGGLSVEMLVACASGNAARVLNQPGGHLAVGQPADIVLAAPPATSTYPDALTALSDGSWVDVDTVMIDGQIQVGGNARVRQQRPAPVAAS